MTAAVPKYVGQEFGEAPPGHKFRLYFDGWTLDFQRDKKSREALDRCCDLPPAGSALLKALVARQAQLASAQASSAIRIEATCSSPLVTGLGIEHPIENGFAFADPFGLPYLPGSSVKGALRRAAEQLALFEGTNEGWTLEKIWWLFGFDSNSVWFDRIDERSPDPLREEQALWAEAYGNALQKSDIALLKMFFELAGDPENGDLKDPIRFAQRLVHDQQRARKLLHVRGALQFWDAFFVPPDGRFRVDIMNPHFSEYYEGTSTPSDDGEPNPITFFAIPPGSKTNVIISFSPPTSFPEALRGSWRDLVASAFRLAADTGFGAKTSSGYGRLSTGAKSARATKTSVVSEEVWPSCTVKLDPGSGKITATMAGRTATANRPLADQLLTQGPVGEQLRKKREIKNASVRISMEGNMVRIVGWGEKK